MSLTQQDITDLFTRIRGGDRFALGKGITLVESTRPDHRDAAISLLEMATGYRGESLRIAVTGAPGVGKSTFIEQFGMYLVRQGKRVAILAVDPSSRLSKGSILGDKTRMAKLSNEPKAFIRPSAAGTSLGGVAQRTRETISLCESAGYDIILVETVGVGQSEYKVSQMVDFFILLIQPGGGDALQGIKRGIVEMADLVIVNKADGERKELAEKTKRQFRNAMHFLMARESGWAPRVITASALEGKGIDNSWETVKEFMESAGSAFILERRMHQQLNWLDDFLVEWVQENILQNPEIASSLEAIRTRVRQGRLPVSKAIGEIQNKLNTFIHGNR